VRRVEPTGPPTRAVSWPLLLAATLAAATVGGVLYALAHRSKPIDVPPDVPREGPPAPVPAPSESAPRRGPSPEPRPEQKPPRP
jgi:hypothetical protein